MTRIDHRYNRPKEILKSSALVRYLFFNCELRLAAVAGVFTGDPKENNRFVGNTSSDAGAERLADSKRAVNAFLEQLPESSGLSAEKILFVVDGMRPHLYSEEGLTQAKGSYFDLMRQYFMQRARAGEFEVVDMQPLFRASHQKDGLRFEFPTDGHWNMSGHESVARAIASTSTFKQTFSVD